MSLYTLDLLNDVFSLNTVAEDDVSVVEPWGVNSRNEKLRLVRIRASIRHTQYIRPVLYLEILVLEHRAVDALSTSSIEISEIAALNHEVRYDTVKDSILISHLVSTIRHGSGYPDEVPYRLWDVVAK